MIFRCLHCDTRHGLPDCWLFSQIIRQSKHISSFMRFSQVFALPCLFLTIELKQLAKRLILWNRGTINHNRTSYNQLNSSLVLVVVSNHTLVWPCGNPSLVYVTICSDQYSSLSLHVEHSLSYSMLG
jgi:hypothetical protein